VQWQEDPEIPFTEDDYRRRKPHPNFKAHISAEKLVIKYGKTVSFVTRYYLLLLILCTNLLFCFIIIDLWNQLRVVELLTPFYRLRCSKTGLLRCQYLARADQSKYDVVYQRVFAMMHPGACLDVVVLQDRVLCLLEYMGLVVVRGRRQHAVFVQ